MANMTAASPDHALVLEDGRPFDWPTFGLRDDVRPLLRTADSANAPSVLATLYDVVGGAPRGLGAQMLFTPLGMAGFLSGGCIEADIALQAQAVLADGTPRRLIYGEGGPEDIRLPCGSRINVFLERLWPGDQAARSLLALTDARRPALWLTDGIHRICQEPDSPEQVPAVFRGIASGGEAGCLHTLEPFAVSRSYAPRLRLVVVGGDPITLAVLRLANDMGLECVLIRPKGPIAPPPESVRYFRGSVKDALIELRPDRWTAIAVLTHDLEEEHVALCAALSGDAGYVGALGSRRRVPERNARLKDADIREDQIQRVHAPIGLPIGGKSPWEIAVSIIAEIVASIDRGLPLPAGG